MKKISVIVILIAALSLVGNASADYTSDLAVINNSANDTKLGSMILKWPSTESGLSGLGITASEGVDSATTAGVASTASFSGLVIPVLATGVSSYLVTKEVLHLTGFDKTIYRLWGGTTSSPVGAGTYAPYVWKFAGGCCAFSNQGDAGAFNIFGTTTDILLEGTGGQVTSRGDTDFDAAGSAAPYKLYCACGGGGTQNHWAYLLTLGTTSYAQSMALAQGLGVIKTNVGSQADFDAAPANQKNDLGTRPSSCNSTCLANVRAKLADGSPASVAAAAAIAAAIPLYNPATPPTTFTLPQPQPNEDYPTYVSRLRADGWLGTVTQVTTEPTALPSYGPNAITRVLFTPSGGTQRVLDPLAWPGTGGQADNFSESQDIQVRVNPGTATPAPTGTGTTSQNCGGTAEEPCYTVDATPDPTTGETYTGPTVPSAQIDWSPLQSISVGNHFPFGAIDYVSGFIGWFNVTPQCPGFAIDVPGVGGAHPIASPGTYSGNLCFANTYMSWVRTMIAVVLWIGAIWFVATRLMKWSWSGDLSEAADDGSVI